MDFSSLHDDADSSGASPWGNSPTSSPRHAQSGFRDTPASPARFPYTPAAHEYHPEDDEANPFGGPDATEPESGFAPGSMTSSEPSIKSPFGAGTPQQDALDPEPQPEFEPTQESLPRREADPQPTQRPQQLQWKLQAKITALERTGRKDLIFHFDVHV